MTRKLYEIVKEHNVTYITIAHRPALKAYHERMLSIGDGQQGFTLTDITEEERTAAQVVVDAEAERGGPDEDAALRELLKARSTPYTSIDQVRFDPPPPHFHVTFGLFVLDSLLFTSWVTLRTLGRRFGSHLL